MVVDTRWENQRENDTDRYELERSIQASRRGGRTKSTGSKPIAENGLPVCVLPMKAPVPDEPNVRSQPDGPFKRHFHAARSAFRHGSADDGFDDRGTDFPRAPVAPTAPVKGGRPGLFYRPEATAGGRGLVSREPVDEQAVGSVEAGTIALSADAWDEKGQRVRAVLVDLTRFGRHLNASGRKPGKVRFRCHERGRLGIRRSSAARRSRRPARRRRDKHPTRLMGKVQDNIDETSARASVRPGGGRCRGSSEQRRRASRAFLAWQASDISGSSAAAAGAA